LALRLLVFLAAGGIVYVTATRWNVWVGTAAEQTTDDAYLQSDLTPLAARVAGYVRRVAVGDYQRVKKGDVLVEVMDDDYRAAVAQAAASVAGAEASLANTRALRQLQFANIRGAEAVAEATQATLVRAELELARQRSLVLTSASSRQTLEQAEATQKQTAAMLAQNQAQIEAAKQQVVVYDAQEKQGEAGLAAQRAALDIATINLGYTRITAPADGMVGQRQVREGQYVGVGSQVMALVPLPHVWVVANYKETQLGRLEAGQAARITVDTFPGRVLRGHVESYAPASGSQFSLLPADNATGNFTKVVQRISVKIAIDDAAGLAEKLRPGMSVVASIDMGAR
jgi:membrane fusion protein (multidrug efflux system)